MHTNIYTHKRELNESIKHAPKTTRATNVYSTYQPAKKQR